MRWFAWASVAPAGATVLLVGLAARATQEPATLGVDLNGDGHPDRVTIVWSSPARTQGTGPTCRVEVAVGGKTSVFGPYQSPGLYRPAWSPGPEIEGMQLLAKGPLAACDANLDGRSEAVVRLRVGNSTTPMHALVVGWDADTGAPALLWEGDGIGVLGMDTNGNGRMALLAFYRTPQDCPVFGPVFVWEGTRYRPSLEALPVRLARALVRMYATRFRDFELKGATDILEPYVYSQLAAGDAQGALDRVSLSLGSLDTAERSVKSQRVRLLLARGDVMAVMGDASQALASYRQAFALEPEPNASPAECFAALHLARARASKGDTQGALHWIDEAEKAAGQPGKFERLRRAVQGG